MSQTIMPMPNPASRDRHLYETPLVDAAYVLSMCPHRRGGVTLQAVRDVIDMLHDFRETLVTPLPSGKNDFIEAEDILREIDRMEQTPVFIDVTDMEHLLKMAWTLWQGCLLGSRYRLPR